MKRNNTEHDRRWQSKSSWCFLCFLCIFPFFGHKFIQHQDFRYLQLIPNFPKKIWKPFPFYLLLSHATFNFTPIKSPMRRGQGCKAINPFDKRCNPGTNHERQDCEAQQRFHSGKVNLL